jgi:hypothetical protein
MSNKKRENNSGIKDFCMIFLDVKMTEICQKIALGLGIFWVST